MTDRLLSRELSPGIGQRTDLARADEQHSAERAPRIAHDILRRRLAQVLSDVVRGRIGIRLEEERGGATHVAGGHRRAVPQLHRRRPIPVQARQEHRIARSVEIDAGTPRRTRRAAVDRIALGAIITDERGGADDDRSLGVPRGDATSVHVDIARGDDYGNSRGAEGGDSAVERGNARGGVGDEGPVRDCRRTWVLLVILDRPARALDDAAYRAAQLVALHHLHVDDLRVWRDAEGLAGDGAGDGGAVRVADRGIFGERGVAATNATRELRMIHRDAAVEDVDHDAVASAGVAIRVIQREVALIDTIEREGDGVRGNQWSGAAGGEAVVTGGGNGRLRARQARL